MEPTYLAPTGSVLNDLLRFVTIRNPQALTAAKQQSRLFIPYPYKSDKDTLYQTLLALDASSADFATELNTPCESFKQTANYLADKNAIAKTVDFEIAERIFSSNTPKDATAEYLQNLSAAKTANAAPTSLLWDNIFLQLIEGNEDSTMTSSITKALKMSHLMANLKENVETDELVSATLIIPQEIINLIRKKQQKLSFIPLEKAKIEGKNTSNALYLDLVSALKEMQNIQSRQFEKQRNQPTIIVPTIEDATAEPVTQTIEKQGLVAQIQSKLSAKTLALLTQYDLVEDTSIDYALTTIEAMIQGVSMQVAPDVTENIAVVNGALYRMNSGAKSGAGGGDDETFSTPNMGYIPVQVADFRVVRQKVVCYKAADVAHIENTMAGELKERSTRRLQHTEESFSTTTERETTQEKDSQTTERFELQRETQDIINSDISVNGSASVMGGNTVTKFEVSGGFAISSSQSHSDKTATTYAKDTVSRALSRLQERVKEERSRKIVTEFEELQKHILDNRGNDKHVSGLYRWVDKVFENQLYNYGKRMILEFSIIEPAAFYLYASAQKNINGVSVKRPIHPSENKSAPTSVGWNTSTQSAFFQYEGLVSPSQIESWNYHLWAAAYGAVVKQLPETKTVSIAYNYDGVGAFRTDTIEKSVTVPDGYVATSGSANLVCTTGYIMLLVSGQYLASSQSFVLPNLVGTVPIAVRSTADYYIFSVEITCTPSLETIRRWQLEVFEAIMEAYERKLSDYQRAVEAAKEQDIEIRGNNPLYNRIIEKTELRKWCIQMIQHDNNNFLPWSEAMQPATVPNDVTDAVQVEHAMPWFYNEWAAAHRPLLQLLEGAIDWELMTYEFLPYYWTARRQWTKLSQIQDAADPQFQNFLQAGAARVFVPVKRGQEAAVAWYLATQTIKTGKDLDKLPEGYEFIKTEMEDADKDFPVVLEEGSTWQTVVPTSLIVMQAASGAVAGIGLPCNCPKEQADGTDVSILTQSKQQTPCPPCHCAEDGTAVDVVAQEKEG